MSRPFLVAVLAAVALLGLVLRSLGWPLVFVDGDVLLSVWDGSYHARRALFGFENFPALLHFDPYVAYPAGASVPMPPLYDWSIAAVARLLGDDLRSFERVAAWASPVLSTLTIVPVFWLGRTLGGRAVGVAAAALLAVLPISVSMGGLGDLDHHAAVALCVAGYAAAAVALVSGGGVASAFVLAALRVALATSWSGSLLVLGIAEMAIGVGTLIADERRALDLQAGSAVVSAGLLAAWLAGSPLPADGAFSSITLSWLHPLLLLAVTAVSGTTGWFMRGRGTTLGARLGVAAGVSAGIACVGTLLSLLEPELQKVVARGFAFVGKADTWSPANLEQGALYGFLPGASGAIGTALFGAWLWLLPLTPFVLASERLSRAGLAARITLGVFTAPLTLLAIAQARFANELAPFSCVALALGLVAIGRALATRLAKPAAVLLVTLACLGLLWPGLTRTLGPTLRQAERARAQPVDPALASAGPTLARFARMVRDATPETSGFLAADGEPEYGILAKPSHANAYLYGARRAVSANGFGPYLDEAAHALVSEFFLTREERRAVTIARRLRARYAVVHANAHRQPGMLTHLLERSDGSSDAGHAGRFRLVVEGPAGGTPMHTSFPRGAPRGVLPYKLFEIVEGVLLEAQARPGTRLSATLEVETNTGRRFTFRARSLADETGVARLRLPYATERSLPTRATGPYRVRLGVRRYAVEATDQDVERGLRIRLADG